MMIDENGSLDCCCWGTLNPLQTLVELNCTYSKKKVMVVFQIWIKDKEWHQQWQLLPIVSWARQTKITFLGFAGKKLVFFFNKNFSL